MADSVFTIEKKISESATTTVYRARQEALDRVVLLKVFHKHLVTDDAFVARFRREARACAALHSENIVQVFDLTEIDGAPAIVMQYVEGKSLKEILENEGKKDVEFVRHVAIEVLKGLSVAHASDIIHRDIKPGNILAGRSGSIMITDFGLASFPRSLTLTYDGMILGTPAYMSPEQVHGEVVDIRTDLFSLGVTLIELLTTKRIFECDSYNECLKRIMSFSIDDVEPLLADFPPDFSPFLRRILAPRKEDRFASAQEALDSLISGTVPTRITPKKKILRALPLAAIVVLGLIVGSIALFRMNDEQKTGNLIPDSSIVTVPTALSTDTLNPPRPDTAARTTDPGAKQALGMEHQPPPQSESVTTNTDSGTVVINCKPWAMVYIDSIFVGQTPLPHPVTVRAGSAVVTFSNPLFLPLTQSITVVKNEQTTVEENFLHYAGYFTVRVTPWADIYVDDQYRGTTPLGRPIITSAGTRKLRLHHPAYDDISYDARIQKGDTLNLSFTFQEQKHQ